MTLYTVLKTDIVNKNPLVKACIENGNTFDVLFVTKDKSSNLKKAVIKIYPEISFSVVFLVQFLIYNLLDYLLCIWLAQMD